MESKASATRFFPISTYLYICSLLCCMDCTRAY